MFTKRDVAALTVTACVVGFVIRPGEVDKRPRLAATAFLEIAPPEPKDGKPQDIEGEKAHDRCQEVEPEPTAPDATTEQTDAPTQPSETESTREEADPPKTAASQSVSTPEDRKTPPREVEKRTASGMKPVIDLTSNVKCTLDVSRMKPDHVSRLMGHEAIVVLEGSLYRIHSAGSERLKSPPPGRCCMYLSPGLRPRWLVSRLQRACLGEGAHVHLLLSDAARSDLSEAVLRELKKDKDFADTAYQVEVRWEAKEQRSHFTVVHVDRERIKATSEHRKVADSQASKKGGEYR